MFRAVEDSRTPKWLVRLALVALAVGAVAGARRLAIARNEDEFEEKLRQLDANRD